MEQNKTSKPMVIDVLKRFFAGTYKPDIKEYWTKMSEDHLLSLAQQIELTMTHTYLNPATVKERIKPLADLNSELVKLLRFLLTEYRNLFWQYEKEMFGHGAEQIEKAWTIHVIDSAKWSPLFSMLEALELYDVKGKE